MLAPTAQALVDPKDLADGLRVGDPSGLHPKIGPTRAARLDQDVVEAVLLLQQHVQHADEAVLTRPQLKAPQREPSQNSTGSRSPARRRPSHSKAPKKSRP